MTNVISNSASLNDITSAALDYSSVSQGDSFRNEITRSRIKNTSSESITISQRFCGLTTKEKICAVSSLVFSIATFASSQLAGNYLFEDDYAGAMCVGFAGTIVATAPIMGLIFYNMNQAIDEIQMEPIELNHRGERALETVVIEVQEDSSIE